MRMKKLIRGILALWVFVGFLFNSDASIAQDHSGQDVWIRDQGLESAIREALGKPTGQLTGSELASISVLSVGTCEIISLDGIELCANLTSLNLRLAYDVARRIFSSGLDLKPLEHLDNLSQLDLSFNQITDIKPLEGLTNLTDLDLSYNEIMFAIELSGLITKPRVIWAFFNNMKGDSNCKRMLSIQDTCVLS